MTPRDSNSGWGDPEETKDNDIFKSFEAKELKNSPGDWGTSSQESEIQIYKAKLKKVIEKRTYFYQK